MELIDILTMLGIAMAGMAIILALVVFSIFARQAIRRVRPIPIKIPQMKKKENRKETRKED